MKKIFVLVAVLMISACSTQRFELNPRSSKTIPSYEGTSHFVFWGIGQEKTYNPSEICGARGINAVDTHHSFLDGLFSAITWGIYAPETYAVYCNK